MFYQLDRTCLANFKQNSFFVQAIPSIYAFLHSVVCRSLSVCHIRALWQRARMVYAEGLCVNHSTNLNKICQVHILTLL